ncbi:hypothetical protein HDU98_000042 [Podochytrium sp. JEL0797]|nr:hypothetical protein HDU98_000042 [Podochytrium sp. JEL0797]
MERLSAMLQRKEQELLLQRELALAGASDSTTLELKLRIQEQYTQLKQQDQKDFESSVLTPQATRQNLLGLLARRVNSAKSVAETTPTPIPIQPTDSLRIPSLDLLIEHKDEVLTAGLGLAKHDIPLHTSPVYAAIEHIRIKSGIVASPEEFGSDEHSAPPPVKDSIPIPISIPTVPSRTTSISRSAISPSNLPLPQKKPSTGQFTTLKPGDWAAFETESTLARVANLEPPSSPESETDSTGQQSLTGVVKPTLEQDAPLPPLPNDPTSRVLITEGPAWLVSTLSSLKECYLFLFTDLLVITKPFERRSSKRIYFKPVSVYNVATTHFTFNDANTQPTRSGLLLLDADTQHKIQTVALRTFESHPVKSISYLIAKRVLPRTPSAVAIFLLTTPRLSKSAVGKFLALPAHALILDAYLRLLVWKGVDLLPAFRMLLGCFRLPTEESDKVDTIIDAFLTHWLLAHPKSISKILPPMPTTPSTTPQQHWQHPALRQVLFGLLALDFEIHYAQQSSQKREDVFQRRFLTSLLPPLQASVAQRVDAARISVEGCEGVHREVLVNMFGSIVEERLDMGEVSGHFGGVEWVFSVQGSVGGAVHAFTDTTPFLNLTVGQWSPVVELRGGAGVEGMRVRVGGVDIVSDPEVLDFRDPGAAAAGVSFRVRATSVGRKVVLFTRVGEERGGGGGVECPAGMGVLVEPEWLRFRFGVEEEGVREVVAVAGEEVFKGWERDVGRGRVGPVGRGVVELVGNNAYGTMKGGDVGAEGGRKDGGEEEEGVKEVRRVLLMSGKEDVVPLSRQELLKRVGTISSSSEE